MSLWRNGHIQEFMREIVRHEGLGEHRQHPRCSGCSAGFDNPEGPSPSTIPRVRCRDCFGEFVECVSCSLHRHARLPLHVVDQWTGQYWQRKSLKEMGLTIQLGHLDTPCLAPATTNPLPVTVIDVGGIHEVSVFFCGCERELLGDKRLQMLRAGWYPASMTDPQSCATFRALDQYHMLHLVGGLNVHDWIKSAERLTDATKVNTPPVRIYYLLHNDIELSRLFIGPL